MNPLDDLLDAQGAPADDGMALMTELLAAVTWLRRGAFPGLTIWDAVEQAVRDRPGTNGLGNRRDPFAVALRGMLDRAGDGPVLIELVEALRQWLDLTRHAFNEGVPWLN
jgi:hypothetical protein